MARARRPRVPGLTDEALDQLVTGVRTTAELDALFQGLKQAITERILPAELTEHLGYDAGAVRPWSSPRERCQSVGWES